MRHNGEAKFRALKYINWALPMEMTQGSSNAMPVNQKPRPWQPRMRQPQYAHALVVLLIGHSAQVDTHYGHLVTASGQSAAHCLGETSHAAMRTRRVFITQEADVHRTSHD